MQHKQLEEEELSLLEKKKQREVAKKEFTDDLKFKTTLGTLGPRSQGHACTCTCHDIVSRLYTTAKNVYRTLFLTKPPERNEFFTAGRMVSGHSQD